MSIANFTSILQCCRRLLPVSLLGAIVLGAGSARAVDLLYTNLGSVTSPINIDATSFFNAGQWYINTDVPFETSDTLNYTNTGTMVGSPGWRFNWSPSNNGQRQLSANFVNKASGFIEAVDPGATVFLGQPNVASVQPSYLWIFATNIINQGTLSIGANGWMQLTGTNINLTRGGLEVAPVAATGSFDIDATNYWPDVGIHDYWWGQTNMTFDSAGLWNGSYALTPTHNADGSAGILWTIRFPVYPYIADSYTNVTDWAILDVTNVTGINPPYPPIINNPNPSQFVEAHVRMPSNVVKQAVFISVSDPSRMFADVKWHNSNSSTNPMKTAVVVYSVPSTNTVTLQKEYTTAYIYDELGSDSGRGLLLNVVSGNTYRPTNYVVSRLDDGRYASGFYSTNGVPDPLFFYDFHTMTNSTVTGDYAAYRPTIDNLVSEPPAIPAGTVTNFPGRIRISANNLDLTRTRVRGEGEIVVNTKHLISSDNASFDCENLSYTLGSTNGLLSVQNLAKESVTRMKGDPWMWSAYWSNQAFVIYSNNYNLSNYVDTTATPNTTNYTGLQVLVTNVVNITYHVLMINGDELAAQLPVRVFDLITHSTNVVVNDRMSVIQSFLIDAESFTLNGAITMSQASFTSTIGLTVTYGLYDWVYTNAPHLKHFTNNGTLTIPNNAHFGDDTAAAYTDFVNNSIISASSLSAKSAYFQNSGTLGASVGPLQLEGGTGKLENGSSSSVGDTTLRCGSAKLKAYSMAVGGALNLDVTNALFDAGGSSGNSVQVTYGFNLWRKPPTGDLLGTSFQTTLPDFIEIDHWWAGEDRGLSVAGYTNNLAIGKLSFGAVGVGLPLAYFVGTSSKNAIYVDMLDLSNLGTSYQDLLGIDPNMTIYFAAAKLSFTPPANAYGVAQLPEEYLDGQFGGRLRWVNGFAGANSSVDVVINGRTVAVNRALRFSKIIDSNGNGIPNYYDANPFDAPPLMLAASLVVTNQLPAGAIAVKWVAAAATAYQVLYSSNPLATNWQTLTWYTNTAAVGANATVWDTNAPAIGSRRFYRVKQSP